MLDKIFTPGADRAENPCSRPPRVSFVHMSLVLKHQPGPSRSPIQSCFRNLLVCYQDNHSNTPADAIRNPVIPVEHAEAGELLEDFDGDGEYFL